ncbi:prostaglandin E synthase 3 [Clonorchis sinensis]|nr:prostaglandin E synthase 3 [Clonorchis sinensis]
MSTDREIVMYIKKKESGSWPRLLSNIKKAPWLKVDFNRWVDENDSEPEFGGMDNNFSSMLSQMSNFNDYGGDDADIDSDDDDLPDLEPPTKATSETVDHPNGKAEEEDEEEKEPVVQEA